MKQEKRNEETKEKIERKQIKKEHITLFFRK